MKAFREFGISGFQDLKLARLARALAVFYVLAFSACDRDAALSESRNPEIPKSRKLAIPEHGIYTGAYIDWGDKEDAVSLEAIEDFERLVGKHQAIVASSSYWGEQNFPAANVRLITSHGSVPLVFWSPWDKPYAEGSGPDKYSLTSIIAGAHDAYIDRWADQAREFGQPLIVSFANEMNGSWFPWSGVHYGGSKPIPGAQPPRYEGPETFKKAYRHVVDRVRARGAKNIQWVLHLMNYSLPQEEWNLAAQYYPGPEYCDWLGFSLYGVQFFDDDWSPFFPLLDWPYEELRLIDDTKPVMICEWGVGEFPDLGSKADWIRDAFRLIKDPKYPNIKACVYWHERWQNDDGRYSNLRVNSTPAALEAYRQGVADPTYLGEPILQPAK
jgi:hypothetical protein